MVFKMVEIETLENVVREWVKNADANVTISVWDKGSYGRIYVNSAGKRKYSGFVDTDGKIDFFWAYFAHTQGLCRSDLQEIAEKHNIQLEA